MATEAFRRALGLEGRPGVILRREGEALRIEVRRGEMRVLVVVPEEVLEWFVDVASSGSASRVADWCDYEGYDRTPRAELEKSMAEDVLEFVANLLTRDLRFGEDATSTSSGRLEWLVDGRWQQAVPFSCA